VGEFTFCFFLICIGFLSYLMMKNITAHKIHDIRIDSLHAQVDMLKAMLTLKECNPAMPLQVEQKRKPGRPKKEKTP
jgi:hypothetical protein